MEYHYDENTGINLVWHVEECAEHYTCDSLIIYETIGDSEIKTVSSPLHCDSRIMRDPCTLPVSLPTSLHLQLGHKYRYCVVLLVPTTYEDVSFGLGCSDVIVLEKMSQQWQEEYAREADPYSATSMQTPLVNARITGIHANITDKGYLHVNVVLSRIKESPILTSSACQVSIVVFDTISAVHRQTFNCTSAFVIDVQVLSPGYYRVCASLDELADDVIASSSGNLVDDHERLRCVEVIEQTDYTRRNIELFIVISVIVVVGILLITLALLVRNLVRRLRHSRIQAQCFLPAQEFEITHKAHYIKLLATTKV